MPLPVLEALQEKYMELNEALRKFVKKMVQEEVWNQVVMVSSSDFGRTLTSNGKGADHAWAGNHFILSGDLKGQQVFNDYGDLSSTPDNPMYLRRGRLIPKYPYENVLVPISKWMGLQNDELAEVFPNIANFNSSHIIDENVLFGAYQY